MKIDCGNKKAPVHVCYINGEKLEITGTSEGYYLPLWNCKMTFCFNCGDKLEVDCD